jgi:hypothetical protein
MKSIGKGLAVAADIVGLIPGFLCQICAGLGVAFGILSAIAYAIARGWKNMFAQLIGAGLSVFLGAKANDAVKPISRKFLPQSLRLIKHAREKGKVALKYIPSAARVPDRLD